jgi:predicted RNA-binding Zn-ribbon protein involved in translation (DUF1610 family)
MITDYTMHIFECDVCGKEETIRYPGRSGKLKAIKRMKYRGWKVTRILNADNEHEAVVVCPECGVES